MKSGMVDMVGMVFLPRKLHYTRMSLARKTMLTMPTMPTKGEPEALKYIAVSLPQIFKCADCAEFETAF